MSEAVAEQAQGVNLDPLRCAHVLGAAECSDCSFFSAVLELVSQSVGKSSGGAHYSEEHIDEAEEDMDAMLLIFSCSRLKNRPRRVWASNVAATSSDHIYPCHERRTSYICCHQPRCPHDCTIFETGRTAYRYARTLRRAGIRKSSRVRDSRQA